jgi:replication-associated recombination protein RarA
VHDLVFADAHVASIIGRYAHRRPSKPLLLYGAPGTGKSEALRLIAQTQFAQANMQVEDFTVNGADAGKGIFDRILNMAQMQLWPVGTPALVVIDELDEFEETLPGKTRSFIEQHKSVQLLASTNYIKKIKPAVQSRMRCVAVKAPAAMDWVVRAQDILTAEGATVTQADVRQMLQNFSGDARDFIDHLEEQVDAAHQLSGAGTSPVPPAPAATLTSTGGTP